MAEVLVGPGEVAIWGGRFLAAQLANFLKAWQLPRQAMPYAVWEWVDRIDFINGALPGDLELLERGVVFGPEGCLALRRDGEEFRWHFVGKPAVSPPAEFPGVDYWKGREAGRFHQREVRLPLWGKWTPDSAQWLENRVRRARLSYPATGERVQVVAWQLTEAGVEAFVWWRGLEEHKA